MDTEKKPENEEDEDVSREAGGSQEAPSRDDAGRGLVSDMAAGSSENSTGKRAFPGSANGVLSEEDGDGRAPKRVKRGEAEPLRPEEQGVGRGSEVGVPSGDAAQASILDSRSEGDTGLPAAGAPLGSFSTADTASPMTDSGATSAQEAPSLGPEADAPLPPGEAAGAGGSAGEVDPVLRCSSRGPPRSSCSDPDKHATCPVPPPAGAARCPRSHRAEGGAARPVPGTQTHGPQRVFSCDLCGFQCVEESLLRAHCLGKTHLRRQNLAARGGLVQTLTKPPFPRTPCAVGAESVLAEPRASNQTAKSSDSKRPRNGSKCEDLRGSISKQSRSGSELLVDMRPCRGAPLEKGEVVEELAPPLGAAPSPENLSRRPEASGTSQGLLDRVDSTGRASQTARGVSTAPRPRPERSALAPAGSFRRRSGTFPLKGQAKKRFNLSGINKRGTSETLRIYMKHFRAQMRTGEAECTPRLVEASGGAHGPRETSAETQEPKPGERSALPLCPSGPPAARAASDLQTACAWTDCGPLAAGRTEARVHVQGGHARDGELSHQTRDVPGVSGRDLEERLHDRQRQPAAPALRRECSSSAPSDEARLRDHVEVEQGAGLSCSPRELSSPSEKDVGEHRPAEKHLGLLGRPQTSQSLSGDPLLQTWSAPAAGSAGAPGSQSARAAQEEPAKARAGHGGEARHASRPQFQCKKCFYKTRSSTVLTRHIKLRHGQDYHFLCKACNLYSLSKEGMEKHIKRSKHLENAKKNNIGLSFEECIERVCIGPGDRKEECAAPGSERAEGRADAVPPPPSSAEESVAPAAEEESQSGAAAQDDEAAAAAPKRGRPKGSISRTCSHCGLLASSITNLTVHIRRKHSHQYSYLCKVCKYYTVTKGDMERHCATKKHRGRVEIEAHGKQSSDIVVGPEGGDLEACGRHAGADERADRSAESDPSLAEQPGRELGEVVEGGVENALPCVGGEAGSPLADEEEQVSLEPEELGQQGEACPQRDAPGAGDNRCVHCEFSAHSPASLELHVKRKHTREFAFYCMACDYYAVTHREMTRHAATDKHKTKRQSYLPSPEVEARSSELSGNVAVPEDRHQPRSAEFQVIPDQPPETPKSGDAADCSVLDGNPDLGVPQVLCAPDPVDAETQEEPSVGGDPSFRESFREPPARGRAGGPEQRAPLTVSSDRGSPSRFQSRSSGGSALNYETVRNNHDRLSDVGDPSAPCESGGGNGGDKAGGTLSQRGCPGVLGGAQAAESAVPVVLRMTGGQPDLDSRAQDRAGRVRSSVGLTAMPVESQGVLMNSPPEAEIVLEEDGPASDSTVGSSGMYETIVSIDDKGQATYSVGRFDASIVRIKSPEDDALAEPAEEGPTAGRGRRSPPSDGAQGARRKRCEGGPCGEPTRIRCDDCGFLADGLSGLNVHIAMKHPTKEKHFHCLLCGKSFYTESNLHQHLASAGHLRNEQASVEELPEGGATFKCVKCTEPFDSEQSLFLHIKGQHEELLREVNKYIVEDTEQINREREENQGNVCKHCGKVCRSSNSMAFLAHIRTHTGSKPFKCKICHFATAQLGDARNHVKRHLGMREYKCHVCGVAFVMKKHLNTHLLGKHGVGTPKERKFTCHLCDRSFTEKWALNNHMKLHTGEKPFKCTWPTCHYSFLTASAMKDHYRTHTGEKSFLCDLCGFAGGTRHALTKHRRQHTGEKPFKCDECSFASTTQSHLTRHKRVHTGEKPYRCPWCDYRSNCAENIRKHILHTGKHEGVKMYNCPKCDYGTNVPVEFRNHLKEQHPDIENPDLAYLHAGIVSKSYECRLKGQGATFVETDSPFTAAALAEEVPVADRPLRGGRRPAAPEQVQQVIIIQGYDGDFALDASVEETAAATLQTLALAGQVARVVHITEDGQVIATSPGGAHVDGGTPEPVLPEQVAEEATQVVVVGGSVEGPVAAPLSPGSAVMQQVGKQELLDLGEAAGAQPDAASALDALLCAVSELGGAEGRAGSGDAGRASHKEVLVQLPGQEAAPTAQPEAAEIHLFQDVADSPAAQPLEVLTQVVRPSALGASQERAQVAFKKVVQGVLQFAVCDAAAAGPLGKDGVTQVVVNEEGAVHMLARDGARLLVQEAAAAGPHGEVSQIIVTEELVQAMVRESAGSFPEGATHYIVTELPAGAPEEAAVYSHAVLEAAASAQGLLQAGAALGTEAGGPEPLTSMVIYTQEGAPAAAVLQSQRDSHELQEA
ncbi:zinc finger protein 407 [Phyllostomus hastatus]|uniref:zinc finger protein 407 n=1 Tax=Phyllostomus hastatus TaxID=9423 RepID=UPI001E680336|nr:zinc finger protein 407 [Phyllostomus hastatus]XP_045705571.1 zinc finger protein 407 [Phyllostomus hastatus]